MAGAHPDVLRDRYALYTAWGERPGSTYWSGYDRTAQTAVLVQQLHPPVPDAGGKSGGKSADRTGAKCVAAHGSWKPGGLARQVRPASVPVSDDSHLLAVHDVFEEAGALWVVMDPVVPRSLYGLLRDHGRLEPGAATHIGLEVASALEALHAAGLAHGQVVPGGILFREDGTAALPGYGLAPPSPLDGAPPLLPERPNSQYTAPEMTAAHLAGTPPDAPTPQGDLWALGTTLYEMVEGRRPLRGPMPGARIKALRDARPPRVRRHKEFGPLIEGLLEPHPGARPKAPSVAAALRSAAGRQEPVTDTHWALATPKRHSRWQRLRSLLIQVGTLVGSRLAAAFTGGALAALLGLRLAGESAAPDVATSFLSAIVLGTASGLVVLGGKCVWHAVAYVRVRLRRGVRGGDGALSGDGAVGGAPGRGSGRRPDVTHVSHAHAPWFPPGQGAAAPPAADDLPSPGSAPMRAWDGPESAVVIAGLDHQSLVLRGDRGSVEPETDDRRKPRKAQAGRSRPEPGPARRHLVRPARTRRPATTRPGPSRTTTARPERPTTAPGLTHETPGDPSSPTPRPERADTGRADTGQGGSGRADTSRVSTGQVDTSRVSTGHPGTNRPEPHHTGPHHAEGEPPHPESTPDAQPGLEEVELAGPGEGEPPRTATPPPPAAQDHPDEPPPAANETDPPPPADATPPPPPADETNPPPPARESTPPPPAANKPRHPAAAGPPPGPAAAAGYPPTPPWRPTGPPCLPRLTLRDGPARVGAPAELEFVLEVPDEHLWARQPEHPSAHLMLVAAARTAGHITPPARSYRAGHGSDGAATFSFTAREPGEHQLRFTVYDRDHGVVLQELDATMTIEAPARPAAQAGPPPGGPATPVDAADRNQAPEF
ncbi:protein kinase domain-containing protein [Streptomyces sp. 796.1]|uniref:protein kinase domain-containing protein n=1 Tax=Streptomyces sp. 796.1 TaxID=3163029 RepID=UPI0039C8C1F8